MQLVRAGIEVVIGRNESGWSIVENDDDVGTPPEMIYDDHWPVGCRRTENIKGRRLQESLKARQGLYLRDELLAIILKLLLL